MSDDARLKRLRIRSWRRGMREMDLILGPFAEAQLADLDAETLDLYERMLEIDDQSLFANFGGQTAPPAEFRPLVDRIRDFHHFRER